VVLENLSRSHRGSEWPEGKILGLTKQSPSLEPGADGEIFGYATGVRSLTQGRATFTLQFSHYQKVPQSIFETLMKERKK
jgi:elongation factor G